MWIEFVTRAQRILEPSREAFYYFPGEVLDLPRVWAEEHIGGGEAKRAPNPAAFTPPAPALPAGLGDDPLTVACVLRSGGLYDGLDYPARLARAVARNLTVPHRFVCLTDAAPELPEGAEILPLMRGWPGFWSKVELFRPGLFRGPVLFLDLDTIVCGPLDGVATAPDPLLVSWDPQSGWLNSSAIRWTVDLSAVWDAMQADPEGVMRRYDGSVEKWGDQGLLQDVLVDRNIPWRWMQDAFPDLIELAPPGSRGEPAAPGVSLSLWMGRPKPHEVESPFVRAHWR